MNDVPKILKGIFTGFLHRAYTVCSQQHKEDEINFLIENFVENGKEIVAIERAFRQKKESTIDAQAADDEPNHIVLPWVPGLSPKFRKSFRKAGYKAVFKSSTNLLSSHHATN